MRAFRSGAVRKGHGAGPRWSPRMGCIVEARFHASGGLIVRQLRVIEGPTLVAESLMAFAQ